MKQTTSKQHIVRRAEFNLFGFYHHTNWPGYWYCSTVCPSRSHILSKYLNLSSQFLQHM